MALIDRWRRTWTALGLDEPAGVFDDLAARYAESQRAYHTLQHLGECFEVLDASAVEPHDRGALELALWFHDAIYAPRRKDNERRSADLARAQLTTVDGASLERVDRLIMATLHDADPNEPGPDDPDAHLLVDVDLAILGSERARFDEYEVQVRREYRWVPSFAYRSARARVLRGFLERERIFTTAWFHDRFEERARRNLERSLERAR